MLVQLSGTFLCAPAPRDYDFEGESGRVSGTSRKLYVLQSEDSDPVLVKVGDEFAPEFAAIRALKFGDTVAMLVEAGRTVRYRGNLVKGQRAAA